jgi:hypothetical protein
MMAKARIINVDLINVDGLHRKLTLMRSQTDHYHLTDSSWNQPSFLGDVVKASCILNELSMTLLSL